MPAFCVAVWKWGGAKYTYQYRQVDGDGGAQPPAGGHDLSAVGVHVAQAVLRRGWTDCVGIGRMILAYWDLPADALAGRPVQSKFLCRTFSDCTTAPRNGLISGCYPLDEHYKDAPEHDELKKKKSELRQALKVIQPK
ncbi:MAG: hypothetical protein ABR964_16250 [Tepidisphaeraceae bacterium]|jgi:hypothetical protein